MDRPLKQLRPRRSLHQEVQEAIKDYITANGLQPGDGLPPETELARRLRVSRNCVREAVKALGSLGILEIRHGSGLFVGDFSIDPLLDRLPYGLAIDLDDLADLLEVRRVLESGMIPAALRARSDQQLADLRHLTQEMRARAEQEQTFWDQDRAFHQRLFGELGNKALLRVIDVFWLAMHKSALYDRLADDSPMPTYLEHVGILEAFRDGDAKRTCAALDKHYDGIIERLERARPVEAK